jgi:MFS family permease
VSRTTVLTSRRFPGWRILGLAILTAALTGPGQTIGVSVFVDHFIADLGLTRSAVSTAYLVGTLTAAFGLPIVGRQIDARGVRIGMTAIGTGFAIALALMSGVSGFVTLAAGFVLIRLFGQGSLTLVSTVAVTLWFRSRRGFVLGLLATGTGMLMSLVPIASNAIIESVGWRVAWLVLAGVIALTVVPIGWFGMIDRPSDLGLEPDGGEVGAPTGSPVERSATRGEAVRTPRFWILVAAGSSVGMLATALNFHQISLLGDAGLTASQAAAMFLPQFVGTAIAGVVFGWLSDRLTGRTLIPLSMGILASTLLLAANLAGGLTIAAYALTLGAAGGASRSVGSTLMPRWFGTDHIGSITGLSTLVGVASTAVGPVAYSLARDVAGTYETASLVFVTVPLTVAAVAILGARRWLAP